MFLQSLATRQAYALRRAIRRNGELSMFDQQQPFANLRRMMASMTASLLTMTLALGPSGGDRATWRQPGEHACSGALRVRSKTASADCLPMGAAELCGPQCDRPDFDYPVRRRQLAGRTAHWLGFLRCARQLHHSDV